MRVESSVTSISWIHSEAVSGVMMKLPFEWGLAHYDQPPPTSWATSTNSERPIEPPSIQIR